jgi:hypothetical protein
MRLLVVLLALPFAASAAAPDSDGFIWIDANTRIKAPPTAAGGGTAPQKAPEKKEKKEEPKK